MLVLLPALGVLLVLTENRWAIAVAVLLFFACDYVGVAFVGFLLYSLAYARMSHDAAPAALVILGSRISDGRVPPLLRSRLDKALEIYERSRANGQSPPLIPSGGKGSDESRAEGEAMAEYLLSRGADPADVRAEVKATNTRENLLLSREIQQESGRHGAVLAVTQLPGAAGCGPRTLFRERRSGRRLTDRALLRPQRVRTQPCPPTLTGSSFSSTADFIGGFVKLLALTPGDA